MKKMSLIVFFLFVLLKLDIVSAEIVYEEYKLGDEVTYNGIDFYAIENSDSSKDYVSLLKKDPLTMSEMEKLIASTEVASLVGSDGEYLTIPYLHKEGWVSGGELIGCTTDYSQSTIKQIVDTWSAAVFKDSDLKKDDLGYKARLLTYDELYNNLGYNNALWNVSYWQASKEYTPSWVYSDKYSYFTMIGKEDSKCLITKVAKGGVLYETIVNSPTNVVRPVINLKKKIIEEKKPASSTLAAKEYKIGDIVDYHGVKFYVIKNSGAKDASVTLLKATPLTVDEVNKYGKDHINRYITYDKSEPYYRKARNQNGYGSISYLSKSNCGYYKTATGNETIPHDSSGCSSEYAKSDFKYVIDKWTLSVFNSDDLIEDSLGYKTRLITLDELINNLNYVIDDQGNYVKSEETPSWVYNNKYTYLTMTPSDDSNDTIVSVKEDGNLNISGYYRVTWWADHYDGVIRPVVTLKKEISNINETNQIVNVPDTFKMKSVIIIVTGIFLVIVGFVIGYIVIKRKKFTKNK